MKKEDYISSPKDAESIVQGVINRWGDDLGIGNQFCKVIIKESQGTPRVLIRFTESGLNKKILDDGVKDFGCFGLAKNLEESADAFFSKVSLYLFAQKHGELYLLNDVIDSGDHFFVKLNTGFYGNIKNSHLYRLFEKSEATSHYGVLNVKKEALLTYCMFFDNGIID